MSNDLEKKTPDKTWKIKSTKGKVFEFLPVFLYDKEEDKIKCNEVMIKIDKEEHWFNFLNLFMFVYFVASDELRQSLALRYERKVNFIPYDVSFKLSNDEKAAGMAKRRIELPVDELAMAVARNEAFKLGFLRNKIKDLKGNFWKK